MGTRADTIAEAGRDVAALVTATATMGADGPKATKPIVADVCADPLRHGMALGIAVGALSILAAGPALAEVLAAVAQAEAWTQKANGDA